MAMSPRIYVSLSPKTYGLVSRLADAQRVSTSSVVRNVLEGMDDQLLHALDLLEQLATLSAAQAEALRLELGQGEAELLTAAKEASRKLTEAVKSLQQSQKEVDQNRPASTESEVERGRARRSAQPPSLNKGVRKVSKGVK
jgi:hypothetical protein